MELPDDEQTLSAISQQLGGIFSERYGCDPGDVDTYAVDDIVFVVMRDGGLTAFERTMIEIGRQQSVVELRRDFQRMIAGRYHEVVADVTGHRVIRSLSQAHVGPQLMIEIFFVVGARLDRELAQPAGRAGLVGLDDLDRAEALEGSVHEEDLDREVGLDVGLGEEGDHLAVGQLLDRQLVAVADQDLEAVAQRDDSLGAAVVHHRLLERREAAAAHHDDDQVVEHVGLSPGRPATVVLAEDRDDPRRDGRQQPAAAEAPWCF